MGTGLMGPQAGRGGPLAPRTSIMWHPPPHPYGIPLAWSLGPLLQYSHQVGMGDGPKSPLMANWRRAPWPRVGRTDLERTSIIHAAHSYRCQFPWRLLATAGVNLEGCLPREPDPPPPTWKSPFMGHSIHGHNGPAVPPPHKRVQPHQIPTIISMGHSKQETYATHD